MLLQSVCGPFSGYAEEFKQCLYPFLTSPWVTVSLHVMMCGSTSICFFWPWPLPDLDLLATVARATQVSVWLAQLCAEREQQLPTCPLSRPLPWLPGSAAWSRCESPSHLFAFPFPRGFLPYLCNHILHGYSRGVHQDPHPHLPPSSSLWCIISSCMLQLKIHLLMLNLSLLLFYTFLIYWLLKYCMIEDNL